MGSAIQSESMNPVVTSVKPNPRRGISSRCDLIRSLPLAVLTLSTHGLLQDFRQGLQAGCVCGILRHGSALFQHECDAFEFCELGWFHV